MNPMNTTDRKTTLRKTTGRQSIKIRKSIASKALLCSKCQANVSGDELRASLAKADRAFLESQLEQRDKEI